MFFSGIYCGSWTRQRRLSKYQILLQISSNLLINRPKYGIFYVDRNRTQKVLFLFLLFLRRSLPQFKQRRKETRCMFQAFTITKARCICLVGGSCGMGIAWVFKGRWKIELDTLTEITELQDKKSNRKCSTLTQITP